MNRKLLYMYIFYIIITKSNLSIFFNFPYSISLSNGNIFVIHKSGISICDYLLSYIIEDIIIFKEDEQIKTEASLSKVTTATIDEYIISLINDKIYIFNDTGNLLYESEKEILEQGETAEYYTLVPIKKEVNDIFYIIGFIHNKALYFFYYKYNYENKENSKLSKSIDDYGYYLINKGLSCQYMKYTNNYPYLNAIVCFFLIYDSNYYIIFEYFSIEANNKIALHSDFTYDFFTFPEIKCIKSCVNQDHSKALVVLYLATGELRSFIYNINIEYINLKYYFYKDSHCRDQHYGLKINYYKEKEDFIYTCLDDKGKISTTMFDKNLKNYTLFILKNIDCEEFYGYSIIYSIIKNKYFIISDGKCKENNYLIDLLDDDMEEEENNEDKEEEENDDDKETENKEEEENGEGKETEHKEEEENEHKTNNEKENIIIENKIEEKEEEVSEEIFEKIEYEFCLKQKRKYISSKNKCINNCFEDDDFIFEYKNICYFECPQNTKPSINNICEIECDSVKLFNNLCEFNPANFKSKEEIIDDIIKNIKNKNLISNESKVIKINNTFFYIAPLDKQQNNDQNISTIYIGDCEQELRKSSNIPKNVSLLIFKMDTYIEDYIFPVVEYEIFNYETGEELELDVCKGMKVELSIPINIKDDNLDKYDPSSGFYNDICYTYESLNGTDVSLKDRKNEYIENKLAVCEVDCEFKGINKTNQKAICKCNIKINFFKITEIIIDKERLYDSFANINNFANIKIMKCYRVLFTKDGLINNIGFFIIIPIIILKLISIIIFYKRDFPNIKFIIIEIKKVKKYLNNKLHNNKNEFHKNPESKNEINQNNYLKKEIVKEHSNEAKIQKNISKKRKIKIKKKRKSKIKNDDIKNKNDNLNNKKEEFMEKNKSNRISLKNLKKKVDNLETKQNDIKSQKENINSPPKKANMKKKRKKKNFINILKTNENDLSDKTGKGFERSNFELNPIETQKEGKKVLNINKNILKYNDLELNSCNYEEALKIDKRTFIEYYFSLLFTNHLLLFPFHKNDYNSFIIKLDFFFSSFVIYYSVNAMFFSDNTMSKIYEDGGSFDFIYHIPQIIYSSLISNIFHTILKALSLSEKNILELKNEKNLKHLDKKTNDIIKNLSVKFRLYFILNFILLLFCWYYVSCFCAIYKNTQVHLIKDSVFSFGLSLIYPLILFLVPGIFRILSLKRKNSQCMFKFSKVVQMMA